MKNMKHEGKIDKLKSLKIKNFCYAKDPIKRTKRQVSPLRTGHWLPEARSEVSLLLFRSNTGELFLEVIELFCVLIVVVINMNLYIY